MRKTDFIGADLRGANIRGAHLNDALFLTQSQKILLKEMLRLKVRNI